MQSDLGKLFIGGISWDTNEERLQEYFSSFGEVLEAVIMKDHTTGRARGFGFVVFSDPAVAERVIKEKHNIDGRMVEAKKAVPRDDQTTMSRNSGSIQGSPNPNRTRKIFVGGLASTVTETDFKRYFEQFGTITDVVVMYDHNTQRPRGFGFITYDSEEAVDKVLLKTFHELNGKMVEVKRAVPKELSPSPNRTMLGGYPYGLGRTGNLFNGYTHGPYDGRFSQIPRSGFANFGMGSTPRNLWGNGGFNYGSNSSGSSGYVGSGSGGIGGGIFGNSGLNWGSSPVVGGGGGGVGGGGGGGNSSSGNLGYGGGGGDGGFGLGGGGGGYGRNVASSGVANGGFEGPFSEFYGGGGGGSGGSVYGGDPTWRSGNSEQEGSGSFGGYGIGGDGPEAKTSPGYVGYSVAKRHPNRGIAG
uniref:RRM domain-containing protein n=1 Tax=Lactuca sativa TaxID=4236 RepID=A0A9R1UGE5_LACSA|nr:hypothetical protein LSAT_V11C900498150 [Lactuca sativa]